MTKIEGNSERMKRDNPMFNKETSRKVHEKLRLKYMNEEHPNKGRKRQDLTESNLKNNPMKNLESVRKMVEKNTGKHIWDGREHPRGMLGKIHPRKGKHIHTKEHIEDLKQRLKGEGNHFYGRHHTQKTKDILRDINLKLWEDEEYAKNLSKKWVHKPTKPEILLSNLIKENNLPFNYVGDGQVMIGGFNPDFLSKNPKHIIEVFGDYWHNLHSAIEKDKRRLETYSKYGYKTLIIWEHELTGRRGSKLNNQEIISKINKFMGGK